MSLLEKTTACKRELSAWNRAICKNASKEIVKLQKTLAELLNRENEKVNGQ